MKTVLFYSYLLLTLSVFGKSGPPIPLPEVSIEKAINLAKNTILKEENAVDRDYFHLEEYIIITVTYGKVYRNKKYSQWAWIIEFIHPIANDHSIVYRIVNDNHIELVMVTE